MPHTKGDINNDNKDININDAKWLLSHLAQKFTTSSGTENDYTLAEFKEAASCITQDNVFSAADASYILSNIKDTSNYPLAAITAHGPTFPSTDYKYSPAVTSETVSTIDLARTYVGAQSSQCSETNIILLMKNKNVQNNDDYFWTYMKDFNRTDAKANYTYTGDITLLPSNYSNDINMVDDNVNKLMIFVATDNTFSFVKKVKNPEYNSTTNYLNQKNKYKYVYTIATDVTNESWTNLNFVAGTNSIPFISSNWSSENDGKMFLGRTNKGHTYLLVKIKDPINASASILIGTNLINATINTNYLDSIYTEYL